MSVERILQVSQRHVQSPLQLSISHISALSGPATHSDKSESFFSAVLVLKYFWALHYCTLQQYSLCVMLSLADLMFYYCNSVWGVLDWQHPVRTFQQGFRSQRQGIDQFFHPLLPSELLWHWTSYHHHHLNFHQIKFIPPRILLRPSLWCRLTESVLQSYWILAPPLITGLGCWLWEA